MRNFKNNRRRYRNNSFDRNLKINQNDQNLNSNLGNISDFKKKNYSRNGFNSSKLVQKYTDLAREALSSGDNILYESFMKHSEHFIRLSENVSNISNDKVNSNETFNQTNISKLKDEDVKKSENLQTKES